MKRRERSSPAGRKQINNSYKIYKFNNLTSFSWSRVQIRDLSQWKTLRTGRVTVYTYCKISGQRGRPPPEAKKTNKKNNLKPFYWLPFHLFLNAGQTTMVNRPWCCRSKFILFAHRPNILQSLIRIKVQYSYILYCTVSRWFDLPDLDPRKINRIWMDYAAQLR